MAGKFLDDDGLSHLIQNIKNYVNNESTSLNNQLKNKVDITVNPLWETGFYSLFLKALERDENTDTTTNPDDPGGNRAIKKALAKSGVITSVSESEADDIDNEGNLIYPNNVIALGLTSFKPVILNKNNVNPLREEYYPPFDVKYLTDTDLAAENKLTLDYARKSGLYFYKESKDINTDGKTLSFSDPYLSFVSRGSLYDNNTTIEYNKVKQVLIGPTIKFRESVLSTGLPFNPTGQNDWTEWTEFTWEDLINTAANHLPLPGIGTPTASDYILTYNTSSKTTKINYSVLHSWDTWDSADGEIPTTAAINIKLADYALKSDIGGGGEIDTSNLVKASVSTTNTIGTIANNGNEIILKSTYGDNDEYSTAYISWQNISLSSYGQGESNLTMRGGAIDLTGDSLTWNGTYSIDIRNSGVQLTHDTTNKFTFNENGVSFDKFFASGTTISGSLVGYMYFGWGEIGDEYGLYLHDDAYFSLVDANDDSPYFVTARNKLLFGAFSDAPIEFNLHSDSPSISISGLSLAHYENDNVIALNNISATTLNGITYSVQNGVIKISGTATADTAIDLNPNMTLDSTKTYTIKLFESTTPTPDSMSLFNGTESKFFVVDTTGATTISNYGGTISRLRMRFLNGITYNGNIKPMLIEGDTIPTIFGNTYDNSLTVNGDPVITASALQDHIPDTSQFARVIDLTTATIISGGGTE